jgi:hypothetical protein
MVRAEMRARVLAVRVEVRARVLTVRVPAVQVPVVRVRAVIVPVAVLSCRSPWSVPE